MCGFHIKLCFTHIRVNPVEEKKMANIEEQRETGRGKEVEREGQKGRRQRGENLERSGQRQ